MSKTVAFLGLGNMGGAISANLVKAGYRVQGYDPSPSAGAAAKRAGVELFDSPADAAREAEVICSSVPKGDHVQETYLGEKGALLTAREGAVCFDFSTIMPEESCAVAEEAHKRGFYFLDTPVSGSVPVAREAKIGLMVGGDKAALEKHRDVLESVCELLDYFGPNGAGLRMKLITNQLVACQLSALAEGFTLGLKAGLDPDQMMEYLYSSTVFRVMNTRGWGLRRKEYEPPKFRLDLMFKDLGLIQEFAKEEGAALPLTSAVFDVYRESCELGLGDKDQGAIREWFEHAAGIKSQS